MGKNINVGCGMSPTNNWDNFDNSWSIRIANKPLLVSILKSIGVLKPSHLEYIEFIKKNNIIWADASNHLPLPFDSVDVLYSSHMLEHLNFHQAHTFLKEAYRVLKPGGIVRIVVPDLRQLVDEYIKERDANNFIKKLHMYVEKPHSLLDKIKYLFVGDRHHQWNYDSDSLSNLLIKSGFVNPITLDSGKTTIRDPGALNLHERADESLYIEANKP